MAKRRVPRVLIDDGLKVLGELTRQGLLDHPTKPVQPQAAHLNKGGDDGQQGKPEPGTTGL